MASKRSRATLHTTSGEHVFLQFNPRTCVTEEKRKKLMADLKRLSSRGIEIGRTMDWNLLREINMEERIKAYFRRDIQDEYGNSLFECRAWERVLDIREPIFRELTLEFITTFEFNEDEAEIGVQQNCMDYRLGGRWFKQSLAGLGVALELYSIEQVEDPYFEQYMELCAIGPADDTSFDEIWHTLGRGPYKGSNTKVSDLFNPEHRVLHRMIAFTLNQRKSSQDKIGDEDVWLLHRLARRDRLTNIPYVLANFFTEASGSRTSSGLVGGQYITRIARYHGILVPQVQASLTRLGDMGYINSNQLKGMKVIKRGAARNSWVWIENPFEQADEEERPGVPQPHGEGASGSHQPPPEWNAYAAYQGLQESFDQFSINQTEANQRAEYLQMQTLRQVDWQSNAMNQFFSQSNPPFQPRPPYQPPVMWPHDQQNPPGYESYDQWWNQDLFGPR